MRLPVLIAALAVAAPIGLYAGQAAANDYDILFGRRFGYEGRWCAMQNAGARIDEDCTFDSFEACRRLVIGGNRGFCTQNPAYVARPAFEARRKKRIRRRH